MFFFKNSFIYLHVSRFLCKFAPKYNISRQEILLLISFFKSGRILLIFSEMNLHVLGNPQTISCVFSLIQSLLGQLIAVIFCFLTK